MSSGYRADIDGLRALCIVPVVLFHAGIPLFGGGFVGVDSFFVISGYLITSLIAPAMSGQSFSFSGFYLRRARRLLPALLVIYVLIVVFSILYYTPASLAGNLRQISASILLLSNFYYLQTIDYFAGDNLSFMLLHTWSLSIEEQFYLVFPAFLYAVIRLLGRERAAWAVLVPTLLSFLYSYYLASWPGASNAAYYHSFSRFWELGIGCYLALIPTPGSRLGHPALRWMALAMLLAMPLAIDRSTPFPGLAALPTVLASLVLVAPSAPDAITRFLGHTSLVYVGRLS